MKPKTVLLQKLSIVIFLLLIDLVSFGQKSLHIYGGIDHDVYLGCLNCASNEANSIWNEYGSFGSGYNANSIWNEYGNFGGEYSDISPFYSYATHPPVIVDKNGGFYGYFTINEYNEKRADFDLVNTIYKYHDLIKDNVSRWYDKIFE